MSENITLVIKSILKKPTDPKIFKTVTFAQNEILQSVKIIPPRESIKPAPPIRPHSQHQQRRQYQLQRLRHLRHTAPAIQRQSIYRQGGVRQLPMIFK